MKTDTFTPTGAANAIICGLEAMCDRKDTLDEAERLSRMMLDMFYSLTCEGTHSRKQERYADFLDGMAERLEEWVAETKVESGCTCDKLPELDMDGCAFEGRCRWCEEHDPEDDGHGPNQEWPPGAPKYR